MRTVFKEPQRDRFEGRERGPVRVRAPRGDKTEMSLNEARMYSAQAPNADSPLEKARLRIRAGNNLGKVLRNNAGMGKHERGKFADQRLRSYRAAKRDYAEAIRSTIIPKDRADTCMEHGRFCIYLSGLYERKGKVAKAAGLARNAANAFEKAQHCYGIAKDKPAWGEAGKKKKSAVELRKRLSEEKGKTKTAGNA